MRDVLMPTFLDELWRQWEQRPEADLYHGGTDLLVRLRNGRGNPPALICLERVAELKKVEDSGDRIYIGAGLTHQEILDAPVIQNGLPILAKAVSMLGSPPIRHMGTIGGNIVTASPAGDTLPPLYCCDAEVELASSNGSRRMPLNSFIIGPGKTALEPGEILLGVDVPKADYYNIHHFEKVGSRKALAIAVVSLAALIHVDDDCIVQKARMAWGSVGPMIVMSDKVESFLIGKPLADDTLIQAAELIRQAVNPISDVRATADYRSQVAANLLRRLAVVQTLGMAGSSS
jgi:xanthine dehydrogenase FAD-binding subunit